MTSLRCPVCQNAFREVLKEGILIDVCTQCRGVWLDRGELEKLLSLARSNDEPEDYEAASRPERQPSSRAHEQRHMPEYREQNQRPSYRDDDDDDHKRYAQKSEYDKHGRPKKKKGLDFLDIFDFGD